ncbi:MAG TPA: isoleucine--tRNA ligase [Acidimicrobiales bacterium]|nr:isoleucine--tRNA ligase [Acidimicrobiales bacterium]
MDESTQGHRYPTVAAAPSQPNYPEMELSILESWRRERTFERSVEQRRGSEEFVFYDGPPFANGLPHYGHLLTGFVKDAMPRFMTMRGRLAERRFGWDCHGLPAETEAEKELGVSGRGHITEFGIEKFNDYCKISVLRYAKAWERYVTRQARWVDFENDYKTLDISYMESVMWAFAELHRKGLVYEGYRVLPYCWECETPLSNFETRQDDSYRDRVDPAVTVVFELAKADSSPTNSAIDGVLKVLVWTTTPWTLPSNLALAVGPALEYSILSHGGSHYLIASDRIAHYEAQLEGSAVIATLQGEEIVGRHYRPLFDFFTGHENSFVVLSGDFVTTDEGTGIVHMAPGFGEDDQRVCEAAGISVICPVNEQGEFDERVPDFAGLQVFDANARIIEALKAKRALFHSESYSHSYPHCWRSDTPLIYRAVSSFFVEVTKVKDRMIELNQKIRWVPDHVRDGAFGKWLEGARDWSISRNRFWGAPIPVWKSDDPAYPRVDVYASLDEIERDFGIRPVDLHRPAIDQLTRPNPDDPSGASKMVRVTDVLDCWFESGAMPFAQLHYPFENVERFESHFPADFICEYIGQTRGWFYTLHVLATALFDRPAFSNVLAHGVLLGSDARKLSKRLKNYPDPEEFFAKEGADTMRWYLLSSAVLRGNDLMIEEHAMTDPIRQVLNPIFNSWKILSLYGETDDCVGSERTDQEGVLDRYILAKCAQVVAEVTDALEGYELTRATQSISAFLDALTNWYVRRSRERFWRPFGIDAASDRDKQDAYDTLHTVLEVLCRTTAPLLPFLSEHVYRGLTGRESVHLQSWPERTELIADDDLVAAMDLVREVCSAGHSIRKAQGLRARLPLGSVTVAGAKAPLLEPFCDLITEELNVKQVRLERDAPALSTTKLTLIPAVLGPRLGASMQKVMAAYRKGDFKIERGAKVTVGGESLQEGEFALKLAPANEATSRILDGETGVVVIDTVLNDDLEREGIARDIIRLVQQSRKDAGLNVADRIVLEISASMRLDEVMEIWRDEICAQTLATELRYSHLEGTGEHLLIDGSTLNISVTANP